MQDPQQISRRPATTGVRTPATVLGYNPFSRERTSYSGMTEWLRLVGRKAPDNTPVQRVGLQWEPRRVVTANAATQPYLTHWMLEGNPSTFYNRQYLDLMHRKANREPQFGPYRYREGNIGSTWRNVKEVLSYGGNRLYYLDGAIRVYDNTGLSDAVARGGAEMRFKQKTPLYALNRHDISSYRRRDQFLQERRAYRPWHSQENAKLPGLPAITDNMNQPRLRHSYTAGGVDNFMGVSQRPKLETLQEV